MLDLVVDLRGADLSVVLYAEAVVLLLVADDLTPFSCHVVSRLSNREPQAHSFLSDVYLTCGRPPRQDAVCGGNTQVL